MLTLECYAPLFSMPFSSPTELHLSIYYVLSRKQVGLYFFEIDQYVMKDLIMLFLTVHSKTNCALTSLLLQNQYMIAQMV